MSWEDERYAELHSSAWIGLSKVTTCKLWIDDENRVLQNLEDYTRHVVSLLGSVEYLEVNYENLAVRSGQAQGPTLNAFKGLPSPHLLTELKYMLFYEPTNVPYWGWIKSNFKSLRAITPSTLSFVEGDLVFPPQLVRLNLPSNDREQRVQSIEGF